MQPCLQEINLYSTIGFMKNLLNSMFEIVDFEVTKIENSNISLFRSHSITMASGVSNTIIFVKIY